MKKFHYTVLPFFVKSGGENRLECKLEPLDCNDPEIMANIDNYMAQHLAIEFRANRHLFDLLVKMAEEDRKYPLVLEFVLTFAEDIPIVIEDKKIGEVKINVPVEKIETLYNIRVAITTFNQYITNILKTDKEGENVISTIS